MDLLVYDAHFEDVRLSGAVRPSPDGRIWVNAFDSPVRQRFTIAHAIGHRMLTMHVAEAWSEPRDLIDAELVAWWNPGAWRGSDGEREANAFAAALLLPGPALKALLRVHPDWSLSRLAAFCGVSVMALRVRLETLGQVPRDRPRGLCGGL